VLSGQRDGFLRPYSRLSRLEPLIFLPSSSSVVLTMLSGPRSRPTTSQEIWYGRESNPDLWPSDHRGGPGCFNNILSVLSKQYFSLTCNTAFVVQGKKGNVYTHLRCTYPGRSVLHFTKKWVPTVIKQKGTDIFGFTKCMFRIKVGFPVSVISSLLHGMFERLNTYKRLFSLQSTASVV
jgi:hypothetical protein